MPRSRASPPADPADHVELRPDPTAPAGNALPLLVRWARRVRDRERARQLALPPPADDEAGNAEQRAG